MIDLSSLGKITSSFGLRSSPTAGASTNHKGIDLVLKNPNVPAAFGGVVADTGTTPARGNFITILGDNGLKATYQHLAAPVNLPKGTKIYEGNTIGVMGSTGYSTGKHLHFEVTKDGTAIDPLTVLKGGSTDTPGTTRSEMEAGAAANPNASLGLPGINLPNLGEGVEDVSVLVVTVALMAGVAFLGYKFLMKTLDGVQMVKILKEG